MPKALPVRRTTEGLHLGGMKLSYNQVMLAAAVLLGLFFWSRRGQPGGALSRATTSDNASSSSTVGDGATLAVTPQLGLPGLPPIANAPMQPYSSGARTIAEYTGGTQWVSPTITPTYRPNPLPVSAGTVVNGMRVGL